MLISPHDATSYITEPVCIFAIMCRNAVLPAKILLLPVVLLPMFGLELFLHLVSGIYSNDIVHRTTQSHNGTQPWCCSTTSFEAEK